MKYQAITALLMLLYAAAPAAQAATSHSGGSSVQADHSTQPSMRTVVTGVSGGHTIPSSPLALLKVNDIDGNGIGNVMGSARNPATGSAQDVAPAAKNPEPGTLAMLLTGLGVMGSIALRRRLARKAA
jgi:PEP-CTERM motif